MQQVPTPLRDIFYTEAPYPQRNYLLLQVFVYPRLNECRGKLTTHDRPRSVRLM